MWMRLPTNVTSMTKLIDSGSIRRPASIARSPAGTHVYRCRSMTRSSAPAPRSWTMMTRPTTKAAIGARTPSQCPHRSERRPSSSRSAAEASGMAISSQARLAVPGAASATGAALIGARAGTSVPSALQQAGVVDRRGPAGSEDGHDDGQPDDDLGRGNHHDEERQDLAGQVAVDPGKGHQGQVRGVEHELDAEEGDDRVAPQQHGRGPDREQDAGQDQVVHEAHCWSSRVAVSPSGASAGGGSMPARSSAAST